ADAVMRRFPNRLAWSALSGAWLASLVLLSPIFAPVQTNYEFLAGRGQFPPMSVFTAPTFIDYRTFQGFFLGSSAGELYTQYLPKVLYHGKEADDGVIYANLHSHQSGAQSLSL